MPQDTELQRITDLFCAEKPGEWDIFVQSLISEDCVCTKSPAAGEKMISASLIKLFIMGAVYENIETGALRHDEVYPLVFNMISVSDNADANRLIKMLGFGDAAAGMEAVNKFAEKSGCCESRLLRLMLSENDLQNYTSAGDCTRLLRSIYMGSCVSETASGEMLEILKAQKINDRLPKGLGKDTVTAHKTGELPGLCCADAGIVYAPFGNYILCAICNYPPDDRKAGEAIAELSKKVFEHFGKRLLTGNEGCNKI